MLPTPSQTDLPNPYDEIPYESHPFTQSHPNRLATVSSLFGLRPPSLQQCRVLELGCASGGNIIPMAEQLPESQFIGVDLSDRQIADGRQLIDRVGLSNVELRQTSITDVDKSYGEFDYVICHGVFSWVPRDVQEKIFDIIAQQLRPNGVAYISYNTYPGWHLRGLIREMMRYHAANFATPQIRTRQARALLDFLAGSVKSDGGAYATLLKQELETLRHQADSYLYHEHLEEVNDPLFFHQFVERATQKGLQYVGEARVATMVLSNFQADVEKTLRMLATDQIQGEQYMDFLRNRTFRETLLCHKGRAINWAIQPEALYPLSIASRAVPTSEQAPIHTEDSVSYKTPSGMTMATSQPLLKAALHVLREVWPQVIPFDRLREIARERLSATTGSVQASSVKKDRQLLSRGLLNSFLGSDLVELHVSPVPCVTQISEKPIASPLARMQSTQHPAVTNRRHEVVRLNDLERRVLPTLDGEHDRTLLLEKLLEAASKGDMTIEREGEVLRDPNDIRKGLEAILEPCLNGLARSALLIG